MSIAAGLADSRRNSCARLSDAPLTDCPECGKATLSKMVTAAGFQLKGSGWYATDFKNGQAKPKPADKPEVKAEDKPAAKEDAKPAAAPVADKTEKTEAPAEKAKPVATPATNS